MIVTTTRRAAIAEKADKNSTAVLNDKGRKNALKVANSFISPAPILNFKASGVQISARKALRG
jgi:hypothetical protein